MLIAKHGQTWAKITFPQTSKLCIIFWGSRSKLLSPGPHYWEVRRESRIAISSPVRPGQLARPSRLSWTKNFQVPHWLIWASRAFFSLWVRTMRLELQRALPSRVGSLEDRGPGSAFAWCFKVKCKASLGSCGHQNLSSAYLSPDHLKSTVGRMNTSSTRSEYLVYLEDLPLSLPGMGSSIWLEPKYFCECRDIGMWKHITNPKEIHSQTDVWS